jgi:hypothetical protein
MGKKNKVAELTERKIRYIIRDCTSGPGRIASLLRHTLSVVSCGGPAGGAGLCRPFGRRDWQARCRGGPVGPGKGRQGGQHHPGGGGRPELAQGGGPNVEKLDEALAAGREAMRAG